MYKAQKYETVTIRERKQALQKLSQTKKTNKLMLQDFKKNYIKIY
jgi:hypothetical protein